MSQPERFTKVQILIHWIIALLVIYQLVLHEDIERAMHARFGGQDFSMVNIHVAIGITILVLAIIRIALRITHGAPAAPDTEPQPLRVLASVTHWLFYILLFLLPLSGIGAWFFEVRQAATVHELAKNLMIALIGLHVVGALAHQYYFKTNVMRRMTLKG